MAASPDGQVMLKRVAVREFIPQSLALLDGFQGEVVAFPGYNLKDIAVAIRRTHLDSPAKA